MGLLNRHAGEPFVLGKINPNDALWLSSAQEDGIIPSNATVQNVASLKDLGTLALGQGMSPVMDLPCCCGRNSIAIATRRFLQIKTGYYANAGALEAVVLYSATELWSLPNVATLAGIYKAVPLLSAPAVSMHTTSGLAAVLGDLPVRFDARGVHGQMPKRPQSGL